MPRTFSILLAEPSHLLGEKMAGTLARDEAVWCVLQVRERSGLARGAADLRPDFILADLSLLRDADTVRFLRQSVPGSRILALTEHNSAPYTHAAERLGLDGCLAKGRLGQDLSEELRRIVAGEVPTRRSPS